jgi:hypothetical protein
VAFPVEAAAVNAGLVAVVCGIIAGAAWRAMLRTGNRAIGYVIVAFIVLSLKNLVKSLRLAAGSQESSALEFAFSLLDLVAVALIAWPLLFHRGS